MYPGDIFSSIQALITLANTSLTFALVKFLLKVYVIVLFVDIILLLKQRGLSGDLRDTLVGMNIPPELAHKKGRLQVKWANKVRKRFELGGEANHKIAIIEADAIIEDLIKRMGYAGENMAERLDNITPGQIENIEELRKAHQMRNRIVNDDNFVLTQEDAEKTVAYFEEFLKFFMVLK